MDWICKNAAVMLSEMVDYSVENVVLLQKCLEKEIAVADVGSVFDEIESHIDLQSRRYGMSAVLLNYLGYYHPSRIIDFIVDNVKRGRLTRKEPFMPKFVYDYDISGTLVRIKNTELKTDTYVIHADTYRVCVSREAPTGEIVSVTIILNDDYGRIEKWIQYHWYFKMTKMYQVFMEIYRYEDEKAFCTAIHGMCGEEEIIYGLSNTEFSIKLDSDGKILNVDFCEAPSVIKQRHLLF